MRKILILILFSGLIHHVTFSQSKVTAEKAGDKIEIKVNGKLDQLNHQNKDDQ